MFSLFRGGIKRPRLERIKRHLVHIGLSFLETQEGNVWVVAYQMETPQMLLSSNGKTVVEAFIVLPLHLVSQLTARLEPEQRKQGVC